MLFIFSKSENLHAVLAKLNCLFIEHSILFGWVLWDEHFLDILTILKIYFRLLVRKHIDLILIYNIFVNFKLLKNMASLFQINVSEPNCMNWRITTFYDFYNLIKMQIVK